MAIIAAAAARRSGAGGTDADAQDYFDRVAANSGTLSGTTQGAVNTFVVSAKSHGYWSKLRRINLLCGDYAAMFTPLASDVPVLLLSGGLDPVTPPAYAEEVAKTLRNHRHVVAAGYGHIVSPHACGPRLVAAFVDGGLAAVPQACIDYFASSTRPPLWSDRMAPAP